MVPYASYCYSIRHLIQTSSNVGNYFGLYIRFLLYRAVLHLFFFRSWSGLYSSAHPECHEGLSEVARLSISSFLRSLGLPVWFSYTIARGCRAQSRVGSHFWRSRPSHKRSYEYPSYNYHHSCLVAKFITRHGPPSQGRAATRPWIPHPQATNTQYCEPCYVLGAWVREGMSCPAPFRSPWAPCNKPRGLGQELQL